MGAGRRGTPPALPPSFINLSSRKLRDNQRQSFLSSSCAPCDCRQARQTVRYTYICCGKTSFAAHGFGMRGNGECLMWKASRAADTNYARQYWINTAQATLGEWAHSSESYLTFVPLHVPLHLCHVNFLMSACRVLHAVLILRQSSCGFTIFPQTGFWFAIVTSVKCYMSCRPWFLVGYQLDFGNTLMHYCAI